MWHSYHFMQSYYKPLINLPKNLGIRRQTAENTKNMIILYNFEHSLLPT